MVRYRNGFVTCRLVFYVELVSGPQLEMPMNPIYAVDVQFPSVNLLAPIFCTQFRADACVPVSTDFLFHTSTIPNTKVMRRLRLRQRNKYKCQERHEDDEPHPIVNLDDSFCFFFIHTSVPTRNMVCPPLTLQKYSQDVTDVLRW